VRVGIPFPGRENVNSLLYTLPIFFGPLTFIRLLRAIDLKKKNVYLVLMNLSMACPSSRGESDERMPIS